MATLGGVAFGSPSSGSQIETVMFAPPAAATVASADGERLATHVPSTSSSVCWFAVDAVLIVEVMQPCPLVDETADESPVHNNAAARAASAPMLGTNASYQNSIPNTRPAPWATGVAFTTGAAVTGAAGTAGAGGPAAAPVLGARSAGGP